MILLTILEENYEVVSGWEELTGHQFLSLQKICDKAPKKLKDVLRMHYDQDEEALKEVELSVNESEKTFPKFYGDFICALSDIPKKVMNKIFKDDREHIFWEHLSKFAIGCLVAPIDVPKVTTERFTFKSEKYPEFDGEYILPKSSYVLGETRFMGKISTIQFTESADIRANMIKLGEGDYSAAFNIVSIMCMKEGEEYDDELTSKRAEAFKELTMDIVWDVFFYLSNLSRISKNLSQSYLVEEAMQSLQKPIK
jgi:hypothetical protein